MTAIIIIIIVLACIGIAIYFGIKKFKNLLNPINMIKKMNPMKKIFPIKF